MTELVPMSAGGARFAVPADWQLDPDLARSVGAVAVALGPTEGAFRPNAVVTTSQVGASTLEEWEDITDATLENETVGYLLVDRWAEDEDAGDRLACYVSPDGVDLTLRQRSLLRDGTGLTLSVTVPTEIVPETHELLDAMAAGLAWENLR